MVLTAACISQAAGIITDHHIWRQSYRIANYLPVIVLLLLWFVTISLTSTSSQA
jgi:hypothetical protein